MFADLLAQDVSRRKSVASSARPGFQPFAMSARVPWRYVVTFRGEPGAWESLVDAPLRLELVEGQALVSACILALESVGLPLMPRPFRFNTFEILYRLAVVLPDGTRSFTTLRSDVSSLPMSVLGMRFSHYLPHRATFDIDCRDGVTLSCRDLDGRLSRFKSSATGTDVRPEKSIFGSLAAAVDTILGVDGSVSVRAGRMRFQSIVHPPWNATFAMPADIHLPYLHKLAACNGSRLNYDSTLLISEQTQTWTAMRALSKTSPNPSQVINHHRESGSSLLSP